MAKPITPMIPAPVPNGPAIVLLIWMESVDLPASEWIVAMSRLVAVYAQGLAGKDDCGNRCNEVTLAYLPIVTLLQ
jgi:hypothetical protein